MARTPHAGFSLIATGFAVGMLVLLAGCTSAPAPAGSEAARSASPTASSRPPAVAAVAVSCGQARPITTVFPASGDLTIGALSFAGLGGDSSTPAGGPNWVPYDAYFFKPGAQLAPGATATLSITGGARAYASIATETGPPGGALTVTYTSCPEQADATGSWWVGGLLLWGRASACVPVTYTTSADPGTPHRTVIALGSSPCAETT